MDGKLTEKNIMSKKDRNYAAAEFTQQAVHKVVDLRSARRVFTFGDVHGNINPIRAAMKDAGYDGEAGDRMIGLGDWLDRGDHTTRIARFIEKHADDLHFVKGNHEQMLEDAARLRDGGISPVDLIRNGGSWLLDHLPDDGSGDEEDRDENGRLILDEKGRRIVKAVCGAPIALTVLTPGGHKIGIVHGEVRRMFGRLDWDAFTGVLEEQGPDGSFAENAMWDRDEVRRIRSAEASGETVAVTDMVENVDHVFHGHTILKKPLVWGNRSWIDVASYKRGKAAFIDIDKWVRKAMRQAA